MAGPGMMGAPEQGGVQELLGMLAPTLPNAPNLPAGMMSMPGGGGPGAVGDAGQAPPNTWLPGGGPPGGFSPDPAFLAANKGPGGFFTMADVAAQPVGIGPPLPGGRGPGVPMSPAVFRHGPAGLPPGSTGKQRDFPSTDNWRLLPPGWDNPLFQLRNGHIINKFEAANPGQYLANRGSEWPVPGHGGEDFPMSTGRFQADYGLFWPGQIEPWEYSIGMKG